MTGQTTVESAISRAAELILSTGARPHDVAIDAVGELGGLLTEEQHAGAAYLPLAEISDLYDDPRGPGSEALCDRTLTLASEDTPSYDPERATLLVWIREEGSDAPD